MRCPRVSATRRRSPVPGTCQRETMLARSGRLVRYHSSRALKPGTASSNSGSIVSTASSGMSPTSERTRSGR